jgi:1-deoxy-D-xylulose-5-phosphate synthase
MKNLKSRASEIRKLIIDTVANNGGHLASNLGIVELIIALHEKFDFTKDRIIFDVSHQCYAHKILSGRNKNIFSTLRTTNGISGFTNPNESPQDVFIAGHAGTALSSAIGLAIVYKLQNIHHNVIAFLGDAALTNGLTLEALNNIPKGIPLIIILNDNGYAISKNVGAIAKYLNKLSINNSYNRLKLFIRRTLNKVKFGKKLLYELIKIKQKIKSLVLPSTLFEFYGLKYLGPIDGHNFEELLENIEFCKQQNNTHPIILHVKTKKGYGYADAVNDPELLHMQAVKKQNLLQSRMSYSTIAGKYLAELAEKDQRIIGITAAMLKGTGLIYFKQKFPHRVFDVGIAEGHAITFSAGLSKSGMLPVCSIYSTFLQRAFDNVFHDIALQNLPMLLLIDRAGLCPTDGTTHHGLFDIAYLSCIPNLIILQPKDQHELLLMMDFCIQINRPCCIRYPRESYFSSFQEMLSPTDINFKKCEIIQTGNDVCIFALGEKVYLAKQLSERLQNLSFTIVNLRFVKPLDESEIINCAKKHKLCISIEDHVKTGGVGQMIANIFIANNIRTPLKLFTWPDEFIEHASSAQDLEQKYKLDLDSLCTEIERLI